MFCILGKMSVKRGFNVDDASAKIRSETCLTEKQREEEYISPRGHKSWLRCGDRYHRRALSWLFRLATTFICHCAFEREALVNGRASIHLFKCHSWALDSRGGASPPTWSRSLADQYLLLRPLLRSWLWPRRDFFTFLACIHVWKLRWLPCYCIYHWATIYCQRIFSHCYHRVRRKRCPLARQGFQVVVYLFNVPQSILTLLMGFFFLRSCSHTTIYLCLCKWLSIWLCSFTYPGLADGLSLD